MFDAKAQKEKIVELLHFHDSIHLKLMWKETNMQYAR